MVLVSLGVTLLPMLLYCLAPLLLPFLASGFVKLVFGLLICYGCFTSWSIILSEQAVWLRTKELSSRWRSSLLIRPLWCLVFGMRDLLAWSFFSYVKLDSISYLSMSDDFLLEKWWSCLTRLKQWSLSLTSVTSILCPSISAAYWNKIYESAPISTGA